MSSLNKELVAKFGKVAVLLGGVSAEREVSLKSGKAVLEALQRQGVDAHPVDKQQDTLRYLQDEKFDRAFIALHGRWGEDGIMQGALESIEMPYTGSGVAASSLAMNKVMTKRIWQSYGLPTAKYRVAKTKQDLAGVIDELGLPLFVKPALEGSSVGISRVESEEQLTEAFELAKQYDNEILIEQFIDGDELTVAILADEALPIIRLEAQNDFYDYEAKYQRNDTKYHCPAGLSDESEQALRDLALKAFKVAGTSGWGRVDIMLNKQGEPHLLELNTVPGMTSHSLVPMAAKQSGIDFEGLVLKILESSL